MEKAKKEEEPALEKAKGEPAVEKAASQDAGGGRQAEVRTRSRRPKHGPGQKVVLVPAKTSSSSAKPLEKGQDMPVEKDQDMPLEKGQDKPLEKGKGKPLEKGKPRVVVD